MPTTQALPVSRIDRSTVITAFTDVICKHPVLRLRLGASVAALDGLAATTSSIDHQLAPFSILRREIEGIDCLCFWFDPAMFECADRWR
jgi:hypothetical protein